MNAAAETLEDVIAAVLFGPSGEIDTIEGEIAAAVRAFLLSDGAVERAAKAACDAAGSTPDFALMYVEPVEAALLAILGEQDAT